MPKPTFLQEISQELARFDATFVDLCRCPVCLRNLPIGNSRLSDTDDAITEEHIIPQSVGGKHTTFLCKKCNSRLGQKQTKWLGEWIELNEGGAPFPTDPKKQRARASSEGRTVNGSLSLGKDGMIEFYSDRKRSNPGDFDAYWNGPKPFETKIEFSIPVFSNEGALRVGYLTAAYGLWFKNFGYSFVLQSCMDIVRNQILNPDQNIMDWNYLIEIEGKKTLTPSIGLMRFDEDYFPIAVIYDHIVIFPTSSSDHPRSMSFDRASRKQMFFGEQIAARFQHRCLGPAVLICGHQVVIKPDKIANSSIAPQHIWIDGLL